MCWWALPSFLSGFIQEEKVDIIQRHGIEITFCKIGLQTASKRSNKEIGSSLEAEIKLTLKKEKFELLDKLDLADYFIVSKVEKKLSNNDEIKIEVKKAQGKKCERCWKILEKKCHRESCPVK